MKTSTAFKIYIELSRQGWITRRDIEILNLLHQFKFMSLRQIARLCFPSARWLLLARRRMLKLYKNGLVDRFRPPYNGGQGTSEYVYCLAHPGAFFLAAGTGKEVSELQFRERDRIGQMMHCLEVAEIYTLLKRLERRLKGFDFRMIVEPTQTVNGANLRPDAYLKWGQKHCFIEVDMGNEWKNKITSKVTGYEQIRGCPPVVFVVPTLARAKQLQKWITPLAKNNRYLYCTRRQLIKLMRKIK